MGNASSASSSPSSNDNDRGGARESKESSQKGMTGPERTQDSASKKSDFDKAREAVAASNDKAAGPPGIGAPPDKPDNGDRPTNANDNDKSADQGGMVDTAGSVFGGLVDTLSAPPSDASGNLRSTSPVADRIDNTVNYRVSDIVGPAKSPRDAAIEMANAEFGVGMEVMRQDMSRAIDKSVADYDRKIADVDQRLAEINEQLSPKSLNGLGGLGTIGFAPLEDARALMAEGRALTSQKKEFEAKRADLETARNIPDTLDMAHIAKDVYQVDTKLANSHINRLNDQELQEHGFKTGLLENTETGFHAEVYRNSITGETVLAFEGTDFESVADWENNGVQGLGLTSAQYEAAKRVAENFNSAFAGEKRSLTGHSLGGGLASYAAMATGLEATTFNAAGLHAKTLDRLGVTREQGLDLIDAHHVEGEILNTAQDSMVVDLGAAGVVAGVTALVLGGASPLAGLAYLGYSDFDPMPEALGQRYGYEAVNSRGKPPNFEGGVKSDLNARVDLHGMEAVLNTLRNELERINDATRP